MRRTIRKFLTLRWLPLLLALLAVALTLPSVWTGWQQDDLVHRYFLLGYPDYKGETKSPLEPAALFYRRYLGGTWVAGLAALFYAIDDARGLNAGWLASRNALLCLLFGFLVLLFHDRWRRDGWRAGAYLAPLFLVLGLLSGESTLGVVAYLLAYVLVLDPGTWRGKVRSLLPYAVVTLAYFIYYRLQGHGAWGSGFYTDLMSEPVRFALAFAERAPILLLDQWALPPSAITMFLPAEGVPIFSLAAFLLLLLLTVLLYPLLRQEKMARFFALGMVFSVPLICSVMPHSRLLSFVGIGGMGLLALWMAGLSDRAAWLPAGRIWRIPARVLFVLFILIHLVLAPLLLPGTSTSADFAEQYIQRPARESEALQGDLSQQDIVMVNPPMAFQAHYIPTVRVLQGQTPPRHLRVLAPGLADLKISRPDERSLLVRPEGGYLSQPFDDVFRGAAHPMRLGERVVLTGMTVEITELTADGRPAEALFEFPFRLEDPELKWLKWEDGIYVPFDLPQVGTTLSLPAHELKF
jgi:hypothetical protein